MNFTCKNPILSEWAMWDNTFWQRGFFYHRCDRVETAAESLACIVAISVYDETWICVTSPGQHKGLDSKQGTQGPSWRQAQLRSTSQPPPANTAARPVSLDMNPRTPPPYTSTTTTPTPHCSDKPHLHPSHILLQVSAPSISSVHHAA